MNDNRNKVMWIIITFIAITVGLLVAVIFQIIRIHELESQLGMISQHLAMAI